MARHRARTLPLLALVAAAAAAAGCASGQREEGAAQVERVVDGDTVVLAGLGRARLIGVDTPEVHTRRECLGRAASRFTARRLAGREVRYRRGREREDRYGRALVYLWRDGRLFNAELVRAGYATTLTIPPNTEHAAALARAQRAARWAERGVWRHCVG